MTHQPSAADIKGNSPGAQDAPRPGTKLRAVYDALRRGEIVRHRCDQIAKLRLWYGLETCSQRGRGGGVRLVGEWVGQEFVPLEAILQEDMQA